VDAAPAVRQQVEIAAAMVVAGRHDLHRRSCSRKCPRTPLCRRQLGRRSPHRTVATFPPPCHPRPTPTQLQRTIPLARGGSRKQHPATQAVVVPVVAEGTVTSTGSRHARPPARPSASRLQVSLFTSTAGDRRCRGVEVVAAPLSQIVQRPCPRRGGQIGKGAAVSPLPLSTCGHVLHQGTTGGGARERPHPRRPALCALASEVTNS